MQRLATTLLFVLITVTASAQTTDVVIGGTVLDSDSKILLPNIRLDLMDASTGDTLASNIRTDSVGRFNAVFTTTTGVGELSVQDVFLEPAYPNPVSGGIINLPFSAPIQSSGQPAIEIYDILGRRLGMPVIESSGVHFIRLRFENEATSNTIRFVKLPGEPARFSTIRRDAPSTASSDAALSKAARSSQQELRLALTHPAFATHELFLDPEAILSNLRIELDPVFAADVADVSTFEVTYTDDTIVIDGAAKAALMEADTLNQRYLFNTSALNSTGITLSQGKILLIDGLALRKITNVVTDGNQTIVETEFAPITEAIQNGNVSWSHAARFDESTFRRATVAGKSGAMSTSGDTLLFVYDADPYEFKIRLVPSPSDTVRTTVAIQVTKKVDNALAASFTGTALLKDFESDGAFTIADRETQAASLENKNVRIEIDLTLAAAGSGLDAVNWKMPEVAIPIRFTVGPVPVTVNVGVQVVLNMQVVNEASATATTKLAYNGSTGFEYNGTDTKLSHETINHLLGATTTDPAASIGNVVNANLGIAFPRVSVQMFAVPIVPTFLVGFVVGTQLNWGPVCKSGYVSAEVKASVDLKFFNLTHTIAESELWKERKDSPPC